MGSLIGFPATLLATMGLQAASGSSAWVGLEIAVKLLITLWMLRISVLDHRFGRIPNTLTGPVFLVIGAYRVLWQGLIQGNYAMFWLLLCFAIIFGLWMLHFIGGGDAKFLMALFALFPSLEFLATLAFLLLVIMLPLLIIELKARDQGLGDGWRGLKARLLTGQILPTEAELQEHGRRYAWTFAIPAAVYAWIYWEWPVPPGWWPW
jgi:Flp pilus assembly protein protease CpaA